MSARKIVDGDVIHDAGFGGMSLLAQLLWHRLWLTCDDWGCEQWREDVLKAQCFPEADKVKAWEIKRAMEELQGFGGGLEVYDARGLKFYHLVDHQKVFIGRYKKQSWVPKPPTVVKEQGRVGECGASTEISEKKLHNVPIQSINHVDVDVDGEKGTGAPEPRGYKGVDSDLIDNDARELYSIALNQKNHAGEWLNKWVLEHSANPGEQEDLFNACHRLAVGKQPMVLAIGFQKAKKKMETVPHPVGYMIKCCAQVEV